MPELRLPVLSTQAVIAHALRRLERRCSVGEHTQVDGVHRLLLSCHGSTCVLLLDEQLVARWTRENAAGDPLGAPHVPLTESLGVLLAVHVEEVVDGAQPTGLTVQLRPNASGEVCIVAT